MGKMAQRTRNSGKASSGAGMAEIAEGLATGRPFGDGDVDAVEECANAEDGPGHEGDEEDGEIVPEGLVVLVSVGGEALQIVFKEELAVKGGIAALDSDVPGQDHQQEEADSGPPEGAAEDGPFLSKPEEEADDGEREKGRDRAFGEGSGGAEEVEVEEPELLPGLVPGIPSEHADAEGCGKLHIGGGSAGEGGDAQTGSGDEGGIEMPAGAESPHVQEDEDDEEEGT